MGQRERCSAEDRNLQGNRDHGQERMDLWETFTEGGRGRRTRKSASRGISSPSNSLLPFI